MTLEKAIKILEVNVPFSRSPEASQIKEAIEIVKFALGQKNIEIHIEEAFLKECECEIENAKEQAVREFAEKLKAFLLLSRPDQISAVSYEDIDNLVSKMFPEQKGEENGKL